MLPPACLLPRARDTRPRCYCPRPADRRLVPLCLSVLPLPASYPSSKQRQQRPAKPSGLSTHPRYCSRKEADASLGFPAHLLPSSCPTRPSIPPRHLREGDRLPSVCFPGLVLAHSSNARGCGGNAPQGLLSYEPSLPARPTTSARCEQVRLPWSVRHNPATTSARAMGCDDGGRQRLCAALRCVETQRPQFESSPARLVPLARSSLLPCRLQKVERQTSVSLVCQCRSRRPSRQKRCRSVRPAYDRPESRTSPFARRTNQLYSPESHRRKRPMRRGPKAKLVLKGPLRAAWSVQG